MLLPFRIVKDALEQNRCVLSRAELRVDEFVLSRVVVPSLYDTRLIASDKEKIRDIVEVLVANPEDTRSLIRTNSEISLRVQAFFGACVAHTDSTDEAFLHAYMYIYWERIRMEVALGRKLHVMPRWGSKEFGGVSSSIISGDEKAMAGCLFKAGVEVDLFSYDADTETLALIELKRGDTDDRAIGQLLRYYQTVWGLLPQREFRKLNINYVWPILVVNKIREEHIQALPLHFRGLLDVLLFTSINDAAPSFSSFRKGAFSSRLM